MEDAKDTSSAVEQPKKRSKQANLIIRMREREKQSLSNEESYYYVDENGEEQGPYTSTQMKQWYDAGYFPLSLRVREEKEKNFTSIELIKRPFMGSSFNGLDSDWNYIDDDGNIQGPYSGMQMAQWDEAGFFLPETLVKRANEEVYKTIAQQKVSNTNENFFLPSYESKWYYKDSSDKEQGPFLFDQMAYWYSLNYLKPTLLIREEKDEEFRSLDEVQPLFTSTATPSNEATSLTTNINSSNTLPPHAMMSTIHDTNDSDYTTSEWNYIDGNGNVKGPIKWAELLRLYEIRYLNAEYSLDNSLVVPSNDTECRYLPLSIFISTKKEDEKASSQPYLQRILVQKTFRRLRAIPQDVDVNKVNVPLDVRIMERYFDLDAYNEQKNLQRQYEEKKQRRIERKRRRAILEGREYNEEEE